MACKPIQNKIETKYGGEAVLRMSADKAVRDKLTYNLSSILPLVPIFNLIILQGPLVTDNGNFILDWVFPDVKYCWSSVHNYLKLIPGIIYFYFRNFNQID